MWRRCHMKGIRAQTVADQLAVDFCVPFFGTLEFFDNDHACSLADDKTVPIAVPWTGGAFRIIISRTQGFHGAEAGQTTGNDRRFRAAGVEDISVAEFDHAP